jgi:hypothetical protein
MNTDATITAIDNHPARFTGPRLLAASLPGVLDAHRICSLAVAARLQSVTQMARSWRAAVDGP